jgi:hypothetical protein
MIHKTSFRHVKNKHLSCPKALCNGLFVTLQCVETVAISTQLVSRKLVRTPYLTGLESDTATENCHIPARCGMMLSSVTRLRLVR